MKLFTFHEFTLQENIHNREVHNLTLEVYFFYYRYLAREEGVQNAEFIPVATKTLTLIKNIIILYSINSTNNTSHGCKNK